MSPVATDQFLRSASDRFPLQSLVQAAPDRKPDSVCGVLFHSLPMARISLGLNVFSLGIRLHELAIR
jgi:hypothetical protein